MKIKNWIKTSLILAVIYSVLFFLMLLIRKYVPSIPLPDKTIIAIGLALIIGICVLVIMLMDMVISWIESKTAGELLSKTTKLLIYSVPLIIIFYIIFMNISPYLFGGISNMFIDIGSKEEDKAKGISILSPSSRVSDKIEVSSYRELRNSVVYFDATMPANAKEFDISVRFKDDFPPASKGFFIGVKDKEEWHYRYSPLYLPLFSQLADIAYITDKKTRLYRISDSAAEFESIDAFISKIPKNSIIATEKELGQKEVRIKDYKPANLEINSAIRGSATFYVYVKDKLNMLIEKFDINMYEGSDQLAINVYDSKNKLVGNTTIDDDGVKESNITKIGKTQLVNFTISSLQEGVYRVRLLGNPDTIIKTTIAIAEEEKKLS